MLVRCDSKKFAEAVRVVKDAVVSKPTLPVLSSILLESNGDGRLQLQATDLEMAITTWVKAETEGEGGICVPGDKLVPLLALVEAQGIDMLVEQTQFHLQAGRVASVLRGYAQEDFPTLPKVEGQAVRIAAAALGSAIDRVVWAAAKDESRPVLVGVLVLTEGTDGEEQLKLAAADGFRLAECWWPYAGLEPGVKAIVPAKALRTVRGLLTSGEVEIVFSQTMALFRLGEAEVQTRLIEGTYPDFGRVIPQGYTTRMVLSAERFLHAARLASILAERGIRPLELSLRQGTLVARGASEDSGEATAEVEGVLEGAELGISVNGAYLVEALKAFGDKEKVSLEVTVPTQPFTLRPADGEGFLCVIMPLAPR